MSPELAQFGPVLVFVGILINVGWGMWQRRWVERDRKELEATREKHAQAVADRLDERAAEIKAALDVQGELLSDRQHHLGTLLKDVVTSLEENTELTKQSKAAAIVALDTANHANAKIAETNEHIAVAIRARNTREAVTNEEINLRLQAIQKGLKA